MPPALRGSLWPDSGFGQISFRAWVDNHAINEPPKKFSLNVGTLNARTLSKDSYVDVILSSLKKVKVDIIVLSETKRFKQLSVKWRDGSQIFLGESANQAKIWGVGFIVQPQLMNKSISYEVRSHRLAVLNDLYLSPLID